MPWQLDIVAPPPPPVAPLPPPPPSFEPPLLEQANAKKIAASAAGSPRIGHMRRRGARSVNRSDAGALPPRDVMVGVHPDARARRRQHAGLDWGNTDRAAASSGRRVDGGRVL